MELKDLTQSNSNQRSFFKKYIKPFKVLVFILLILWLYWQIRSGWKEIIQYNWQINYAWLLLSGLFYLIAFLPSAFFWFLLLRWLEQKVPFWLSLKSFYFSQLGKYIPGKAMVVLIRMGMISEAGVRPSIAVVSVFYETLTMMGSGAFFAACIVLCSFKQHWIISFMAFGVAFISLLPLMPPVFTRVLRFLHIAKDDEHIQKAIGKLGYAKIIKGFLLMFFLWSCFGLSLWAAIRSLGIITEPLHFILPLYVAVVALAMTIGFVVAIAPGGLGVREAIISALLLPYFTSLLKHPCNSNWPITPESLSTIVSLVQRITSISAEVGIVILFCISALFKKLINKT